MIELTRQKMWTGTYKGHSVVIEHDATLYDFEEEFDLTPNDRLAIDRDEVYQFTIYYSDGRIESQYGFFGEDFSSNGIFHWIFEMVAAWEGENK